MLSTGMQALKASPLSDADVQAMADGACMQMDAEVPIASAGSEYNRRLKQIASHLSNEIEGTSVNYKVYLTDEINAWAMANGCVRVYSGLMDLMSDNKIEGVLGHEMGHVALGHTKKAMQAAYATSVARGAMVSTCNSAVSVLSSSQLDEHGEARVNAQFSQTQESDADGFSYDLLKRRHISEAGLANAFDKLAQLGGGDSSMFDSHPGSAERAEHIRQRIANERY